MKTASVCVLIGAMMLLPTGGESAVLDFSSAVVTGTTQAPGVWYTDRYAPAGFSSPVNFMGSDRLLHQINAADGASSRPGSFSGSFYNTQGRKYDLAVDTTAMSIDLYVPADWAGTGRRMAGFWGTAFNASNAISFYPILEFASDGSGPRFQGWNGSGWTEMGLPSGFAYDQTYTLSIQLAGTLFNYSVGDLSLNVDANGSVRIGNTILQGYNTTDGVTYDIHWDNFQYNTSIPEPSSMVLLTLGLGFVGWRRMGRKGSARG